MKSIDNIRRLIGTAITSMFGRPIWIECCDGEMLSQRAITLPDGRIVANKIYGKVIGNADGTFHINSYCKKWWPRETLFERTGD